MDASTMANLVWLKMCEDEHVRREYRPCPDEKGYSSGRFILEDKDHNTFIVSVTERKAPWNEAEIKPDVEED